MVIYERLEFLPSYSALSTFNVCSMVVWRLLGGSPPTGEGQSDCHPGQSLSEVHTLVGVGETYRVATNHGNRGEYIN